MLAYCEVGLCPKLYSFNLLVSLQLVKPYALLLDLKLTSRFTPASLYYAYILASAKYGA